MISPAFSMGNFHRPKMGVNTELNLDAKTRERNPGTLECLKLLVAWKAGLMNGFGVSVYFLNHRLCGQNPQVLDRYPSQHVDCQSYVFLGSKPFCWWNNILREHFFFRTRPASVKSTILSVNIPNMDESLIFFCLNHHFSLLSLLFLIIIACF